MPPLPAAVLNPSRTPRAEIGIITQMGTATQAIEPRAALGSMPIALAAALFDRLPDVVFFAKDAQGRYTHANRTLALRLGLRGPQQLIGRRVGDLFPSALGESYAAQDQRVLRRGVAVVDQLEVHLLPNGDRGWCLTCKYPLREESSQRFVGLVGLSRDLPRLPEKHVLPAALRQVISRIRSAYAEPLSIAALASAAGISMDQLERRMRQLLGIGPRQLLVRTRIEAAMQALAGEQRIAAVAQACGYSDQSAFARQFKAVVGVSPSEFRTKGPGPRAQGPEEAGARR